MRKEKELDFSFLSPRPKIFAGHLAAGPLGICYLPGKRENGICAARQASFSIMSSGRKRPGSPV